MKNIKRFSFVLTILSVVLGVLSVTAPAANADGEDTVTYQLNLDVSDAASSQSSFDYKSTSIVRSAVNDKGQIVLTPVNKPSAHWISKYAKKCPVVQSYPTKAQIRNFKHTNFVLKGAALKQFRRATMSDKAVKKLSHGRVKVSVVCFQLPPGKHFPDTGLALNGQVHGWDNVVKGSAMLFEIAKVRARRAGESTDAFVPIRRGQANSKGVYSIGDCGNKKPAVVEFTHQQVEYNDTDSYWWSDKGDVLARVHVGGSATISQGNCSMTLNYDFFAQGSAAYAVIVQGKTSTEAHGKVVNVVSKQSAHADASASAAASVKANLKAQFTGCNNPPPQPTMTLSLDKPNDVDQSVATPGEPIDWSFTPTYGHAVAPTGEGDVTYKVSAEYGFVKFITANSPCETNGLRDNVVTTITKPSGTYDLALCYIASTENPASYGGSDTITLSAVFAGKTYTDSKSITVNPTPTIPW